MLQVLLPIEGLVDLDALKGRLEKDIAKAEKEIKGLAGRLGNPNFAGKAPPEVVVGRQLTRTLPSSYFQLRHNIQAMRATFETNSWAEKQAKIAFRKDLCSVVAKTV